MIFFIYLYQKWIYPIDYKRVNEFGVTGEDLQSSDVNDDGQANVSNENSENGVAHAKSE